MNQEPEIKNAKITSTMLGVEDHGILTCFLHLDYGGTGQGFGGWTFDHPIGRAETFKGREGTAWGMEFIRRILDLLEVESWEKIPGNHCRVKADWGKVHSIGHITKDKWFTPEIDLVSMKPKSDMGAQP